MPSATFILSDMAGVTLGEIKGPTEAAISLPHLRLGTTTIKVPMWHPRAEDAMAQDTLLWVKRTDHLGVLRPVLSGVTIAVEENGGTDGQTCAITAVSPFWRLNKRLLGKTKAGFAVGTPEAPVDIGEIMQTTLDTANGEGFTGIVRGTTAATNAAFLQQVWLKPVAQQIAELSASIAGPEFEIAPIAQGQFQGGVPILAQMNAAALIGGITREDAIFEYGTSRGNCTGYNRARTLDGVMTKGWISVSGWPDGTTDELRTLSDAAAIAARGLYEDIVPDGGIIDPGLRDSLVSAHLDVRYTWRQTITFTPEINARPGFQSDYNVGDFIRARAVVRGRVRFDAWFRVWGVTLTYDANGNEQVELELLPQEPGV